MGRKKVVTDPVRMYVDRTVHTKLEDMKGAQSFTEQINFLIAFYKKYKDIV